VTALVAFCITNKRSGNRSRLELRASGTCVVPVTGVSSTAGAVEVYAGVPTTGAAMTAGATKVVTLS